MRMPIDDSSRSRADAPARRGVPRALGRAVFWPLSSTRGASCERITATSWLTDPMDEGMGR
ncbi:hypothetical protein BN2497_483 [Janthinobacterium sp. CG23_2]|nr:hypothetical protein BN2497_483 [Janthinobacterium sp. CG23_2]CUU26639.1 hypothetical protein BN3177_483 [Janthinobacterium sp. CG23_2]